MTNMSRIKEIGSYQYHSQYIGKGSFCKVYKGKNIKTNEIVAIKKINENIGFLQNKIQLPQHKEKKNRTIT